jgi:hypothetical protein
MKSFAPTRLNNTSDNGFPFQPQNSKRILYSFLTAGFFIFLLAYILDESSNTVDQGVQTTLLQKEPLFQDNDVNDKEIKLFQNMMHKEHPRTFAIKPNKSATVLIAAQSIYTIQYNSPSQEVQTSKSYVKDKVLNQLNNERIQYQVIEKLGASIIRWNGILFLPKI